MIINSFSQRRVVLAPRHHAARVKTPDLWTGPLSTRDGGSWEADGNDLTISGGEIEIRGPGIYEIDTEGAAASDELTTINGGVNGTEVVLKSTSNVRQIKIVPSVGNIKMSSLFWLNSIDDRARLICDASGDYCEAGGRSSNA